LGERRRLQGLGGAVLREGAVRALAAGDTRSAVALATRLLGADPLSEDAHVLYGFATEDERSAFRQLIRISGVGARTALSLLSGLSDDRRRSRRAEALLESGEAAIALPSTAGSRAPPMPRPRRRPRETAVRPPLLGWGSALVTAPRGATRTERRRCTVRYARPSRSAIEAPRRRRNASSATSSSSAASMRAAPSGSDARRPSPTAIRSSCRGSTR
jgi:hypothetical protein